jgi:hypothetical protein
MKTISEILQECKVGDKLSNNFFEWIVTQRYQENNEIIVIATPEKNNQDSFELWSSGVESYSFMPNLKKIKKKA